MNHTGRQGLVGVWRVNDVLIDCGPTTCISTLVEHLGNWQPKALLLTHIHLDHAGGAGVLVERWPKLEVWVHERGARHLIAPDRLMESAYRVFGRDLDRLFGVMVPVPPENVRTLVGGETVRGFRAEASLGHASHHLFYVDLSTRQAYPGDIAGVVLDDGPIFPPTPPPDIDLVQWRESLDWLESYNPVSLGLPHFGLVENVGRHLAGIRLALDRHETVARQDDLERYESWFTDCIAGRVSPELVDDYRLLVPPAQNFAGLKRYLDVSR